MVSQILVAYSQQDDATWYQFRGNERNGTSPETGLLKKWSKSGPDLLWKKDLGSGFSEIIISDNVFYTMISDKSEEKTGSEYMAAFDAKSGTEFWRTKVDSIFIDVDDWGNGPRSTPTYDKENIYCLSSFGKLYSISRKNGKINWTVDFVAEFNSVVPRWGFSTSPMLINNTLIMEVGGADSKAFMAFDPKNGKVIWEKANGNSTYSSPVLFTIENEAQILFANSGFLHSFNTKGDTLWTYKLPLRTPTAAPVLIDNNKIFLSALGAVGFVIIEIKDNKATEVLQGSTMKNDYSSSCYFDGYIYGFNTATLQCISPETGEKLWTKRGFGKGCLILIDGKLLVLSDQGKLVLVEATPDAYNEISIFQAVEGKSWTAPSFNKGRIFIRNLTEMACYKLN